MKSLFSFVNIKYLLKIIEFKMWMDQQKLISHISYFNHELSWKCWNITKTLPGANTEITGEFWNWRLSLQKQFRLFKYQGQGEYWDCYTLHSERNGQGNCYFITRWSEKF